MQRAFDKPVEMVYRSSNNLAIQYHRGSDMQNGVHGNAAWKGMRGVLEMDMNGDLAIYHAINLMFETEKELK